MLLLVLDMFVVVAAFLLVRVLEPGVACLGHDRSAQKVSSHSNRLSCRAKKSDVNCGREDRGHSDHYNSPKTADVFLWNE